LPGGEGRPDDLLDMLGAGGGIEQQFCFSGQGAALWIEENPADGVGDRTTTRFTGGQNRMPPTFKGLGEAPDLRSLATSLDSLEGNENAVRGHVDSCLS
jgi:hypothetical protein